MECGNLSLIPLEVLELILESDVLSFNDVCKFGSTCTRFWVLVSKSNQIWKAKFIQRWPQLVKHEVFEKHPVSDWLTACKQRCLIGQQTMELVRNMVAPYLKLQELSSSDFKQFEELYSSYGEPIAIHYMIDELMLCAHHDDVNTNLSNKYYCQKVLRHLQQIYLAEKWDSFKNLPPEEQLLETGAVLVAQWCQPMEKITNKSIASQINWIADEVRNRLRQEYGEKHAALCISAELQEQWQTRNLADNYYSPLVSRQVITMVSTVLFKELGFFGNSDMYYSPENSFINKVLELRRGIPITLSILFESITRRLGVKCEPVSFPGHFLLRWRDTYKKDAVSQYFYIDVFNGGTFLGKDSCPQFSTSRGRCPMSDIFRFGPATAIQVVERMANNLEVAGRQRTDMNGRTSRLRSALELLYLINPTCLEGLVQISRLYMDHTLDLGPICRSLEANVNKFDARDMGQVLYLMGSLKAYCQNYPEYHAKYIEEPVVKRRDNQDRPVAYAVGMVMHHRQYHYKCVLIGWDAQCAASKEWMLQMNVSSLSRKQNQPFYHVLVNDGTIRYAAEENLELDEMKFQWIDHIDVGRYFDTFCGSHYQPNHELQRLYPDDPPVLRRCLGLQ